jgi:RNA polymerase sigma factor (sigma-70 family)
MALDSLGAFMDQAGRYELLTTDEEIHLSRRIQRWRELKEKEGELTKEERRAIKSGLRARERLVKCNLRLVVHVSKKYTFKLRGFAMEHADLIQEGMFGLQRAAELFDGTKGYKFSTYAYWWIRQSISRSLETYDRCVRIPTNCLQKLNKARKLQNEYMQEHGKPASLEYIAKEISMDIDLLRLSIERSTYHTSLDSLSIENGTTLLDLMHTDEDLYDNADQKFEYDKLSQALATLSDADYELIQRIYGLNDAPVETMREIAGKKSYGRERVRQRRNAAINKLATVLRRATPISSTEQMSLIQ